MDALLALVSRASQAICLLKLCSETDDFSSVAAALPHENAGDVDAGTRFHFIFLFSFFLALRARALTHTHKKKQ